MSSWTLPHEGDPGEHWFKGQNDGPQIEHLDAAMKLVRDKRRAVDGGAHVGTWTVRMANWFEDIIAFEPAPMTYLALLENLYKRGLLTGKRVKVWPVALGDGLRYVRIMIPGKASMSAHCAPVGPVPMLPLDALNLDHLGFLKLDLEGCEGLAIKGAQATLRRCRPVLLIEWKPEHMVRAGCDPEETEALLKGLGYRLHEMVGQDRIMVPEEWA